MMLQVSALNCFYGPVQVLRDFALELRAGEVLCLLGRNGAGKTTALKAIMGLVRARTGAVQLDGVNLTALPAHAVPKAGIGYCPQGRRLFSELTVEENLRIGLMARDRGAETLAQVLELFPLLRERLRQGAGTLSGGEQQMLAMARALCLEPKVLLLDEPTEGLMPSMIARILAAVRALQAQGVATILVEQRVEAALSVADRILFVENGRSRQSVSPDALRADPALLHHYVGVGLKSGKQGASQS
jgi:branched-chain amino acid transport system ATP-binding protein